MKKVKLRILMMLMAMMAVMSLIGCEKRDNDQEQKRTTSAKVEKTNKKEEQEEESEEWEEEYEEQEESDLYALYDQYLEEEAPLLLSDYEQGEYGFYDVDGDDVDELILREPGYLYIIQYRDGELVNVYQEGVYSDLLENGMVRYYRPGTAPEHENYAFYVLIGDEYLEEISFAWYDNETVGDEIYDEDDYYEIDGEDITMEEWMETLEEYMYYEEADITFMSL